MDIFRNYYLYYWSVDPIDLSRKRVLKRIYANHCIQAIKTLNVDSDMLECIAITPEIHLTPSTTEIYYIKYNKGNYIFTLLSRDNEKFYYYQDLILKYYAEN
jgi:hypothetical protein